MVDGQDVVKLYGSWRGAGIRGQSPPVLKSRVEECEERAAGGTRGKKARATQ